MLRLRATASLCAQNDNRSQKRFRNELFNLFHEPIFGAYRSFGLLLALLLFLVGVSLYNFRLVSQADASQTRSYQTLLESESLLQALLNMETGVRGFLLTGEPQFLEPYQRGRFDFDAHFARAQNLLNRSPAQIVRLNQLRALETNWNDAMIAPALQQRRDAPNAEVALRAASARALERKAAVDQMREVIRDLETQENALLQQHARARDEQRGRFELILWGGGLFSVLLTATLATFAARAANQLKTAAARLETSNAQLLAAKAQTDAENQQRRAAEERLREAVEDLERSNAELEQFAYVASHDLQEPLRAVAGCVQVLQKRYGGQLDARADQFIGHAVDGAQRMQNLINDLLAYSRVGTHGKPFDDVAMETVADHALRNLGERIRETGVAVTRDALPAVWGDAGQLELVLQNLVSNALKFRGEADPQVHIGYKFGRADGSDNPNFQHIFSVSDNGLGIESQYFERIFVMFQRLHTRTEYPGTGIGLAICKKIVERHGGTIGLESAPGAGTTFWFSVPVRGK